MIKPMCRSRLRTEGHTPKASIAINGPKTRGPHGPSNGIALLVFGHGDQQQERRQRRHPFQKREKSTPAQGLEDQLRRRSGVLSSAQERARQLSGGLVREMAVSSSRHRQDRCPLVGRRCGGDEWRYGGEDWSYSIAMKLREPLRHIFSDCVFHSGR